MSRVWRIGTRESQLAVWQATKVQQLLLQHGHTATLVYIKSEGDINLQTPLYEIGVQGIFTKALDIALLNNDIDIAVHSMKDVPTHMARGVVQAAVLPRASYKDLLVPKTDTSFLADAEMPAVIATSSIRRRAQWLHRYPWHQVENLRGNVNTRLRKVAESSWQGAIFAAAGLERIGLRPEAGIDLDWMLPAPAQGAILAVCRHNDEDALEACQYFNDRDTALCTAIEREFLRALMGGCSTPISALAAVSGDMLTFEGNILTPDGRQKKGITMELPLADAEGLGDRAAAALLEGEGADILNSVRNGK